MDLSQASEESLIAAAQAAAGRGADRYLQELYARYYTRVAFWCLRYCDNRDEAADLAQDVFLRVHTHIGAFRMGSKFSTWLYTVVRSVAINRGVAERRRRERMSQVDQMPDTADPGVDPALEVDRREKREALRKAAIAALEPLEAKILYLHYVDGMSLPAISALLELSNRSGAKAFIVSGIRKLRRHVLGRNHGRAREKRS